NRLIGQGFDRGRGVATTKAEVSAPDSWRLWRAIAGYLRFEVDFVQLLGDSATPARHSARLSYDHGGFQVTGGSMAIVWRDEMSIDGG
ncbi:hypothetical protein, partial [Pseudomonas sp. GW456-L14]|uniref:hypothetical protein n=1 Tax=Pseudomonas sp. GW456-L14 TaxID=2070632 RepID=UPI001C48C28A